MIIDINMKLVCIILFAGIPITLSAIATCPSTHRYAYLNGAYCCEHDSEGFDAGDGVLCDGSGIGLASSCCKGGKNKKCVSSSCRNYVPVSGEENNMWMTALRIESPKILSVEVSASTFNEAFKKCPVVRGLRAVYVRKTDIPDSFNAYSIFAQTWSNNPSNLLNVDFELYDNLEDAVAKRGKWAVCIYGRDGQGFPLDCGKVSRVSGSNYFSLPTTRHSPYVPSSQGLEIYTGPECPSEKGEGDASGDWMTALRLEGDMANKTLSVAVTELTFNDAFKKCPVVRGLRSVYVRISDIPDTFNAYRIFAQTWASRPSNKLNEDFELYDNIDDAVAKQGQWQVCYYGSADQGFPLDCGKTSRVTGSKYFTLPTTNHAPYVPSNQGLEIYTGQNCPSSKGQGGANRVWMTALRIENHKSLSVEVTEAAFNNAFKKCPVVRGLRAVYVRTSAIPDTFNAYRIFAQTWSNNPSNVLNEDFDLYDNINDAVAKQGKWKVCIYGREGQGFPLDCGKFSRVSGSKYFTLPATRHFPYVPTDQGLEIYTGDSCPSANGQESASSTTATVKKSNAAFHPKKTVITEA